MYNTQAPQPQMIVVPTGYSGQIPGYPGQTTGHSGQTAGYSGQITTGHSGQTVQSQTQSDPEYQHQMFNNPGLTNVPLNQGPNEELSFPSGEEISRKVEDFFFILQCLALNFGPIYNRNCEYKRMFLRHFRLQSKFEAKHCQLKTFL